MPSTAGKAAGLGFISRNIDDLYRPLSGTNVNANPWELHPPNSKLIVEKASAEAVDNDGYPVGVLKIKVRMSGDSGHAVVDVCRGEYMKRAIVDSLAESVSRMSKVKLSAEQVLFCMEDVGILDVQMPTYGNNVWQFCVFRFDYKLAMRDYQSACQAVDCCQARMADFEADFCKVLEFKYRDIYHLTILGLQDKQFMIMDGFTSGQERRLYKAAQANECDTILSLVAQGVNVNARPKESSCLGQLIDEEDRAIWLGFRRAALHGAAEAGHMQAMRTLLDSHADVNLQDEHGFHALYLAAGGTENPAGDDAAAEAVRLLLDRGASLNLQNGSGYTALHNACGSGECSAVKALLDAKADMTIRSKEGSAPIHVAVINDQPKAVEVLANYGANLNMPAFGGNTPVHEGVMQNNPDIVQKLLDLKADINIESGPEHAYATPLGMANGRIKKKVAKKLQALGALEKIEHEYEDVSEGDFEPGSDGDFIPKVKGRSMPGRAPLSRNK